jgi:hypothetical protein
VLAQTISPRTCGVDFAHGKKSWTRVKVSTNKPADSDLLPSSKIVIWTFLALAVVLRLRAFAEGRALWLDESALAVNFIERSLVDILTLPLENNQSAPPGFLATTFLVIKLFGLSEFSIRLVPLISSLGAVFLFYSISIRSLSSRIAIGATTALFAISPVLVYYSTEFKQYSVDVLATLFFIWLLTGGFKTQNRISRFFTWFMIAWLVASSLIALPLFGLYLLLELFSLGPISKTNFVAFLQKFRTEISVGVIFGIFHGLHIVLNSKVESMTKFWVAAGGLPARNTPSFSLSNWLYERSVNLLSDPFISQQASFPRIPDSPKIWVPVIFLISVSIFFYARNPVVVYSLAAMAMTPILAFAYVYPIGGRLTLFTVPLVILLLGFGLQLLEYRYRKIGVLLSAILITAIMFSPVQTSLKFALNPNDSKDTIWLLEQIRINKTDSDILLTDRPNINQVKFHEAIGYESGVKNEPISVTLSSVTSDWMPPSSSLWLVSTHRINEAEEIVKNLESRGYVEQCRFEGSAFVVLMIDESKSDSRECRFSPRS